MAKTSSVTVAGVTVKTSFGFTLRTTIANARAAFNAYAASVAKTGRSEGPAKDEYRRLVTDIVGLSGGAVRQDAVWAWIAETA